MKNFTSFGINEASSEIIDKMKNALKEERKALRAELKENVSKRKAIQERNNEILARLKEIRAQEGK